MKKKIMYVVAMGLAAFVLVSVPASAAETDVTAEDQVFNHYDCDIDLDNYIQYEAVVNKLYIADQGDGDKVYLVDTNKHVFVLDFDNPELLLLEEGDHIILYVDKTYSDCDVIPINFYKQYGFVVSE